MPILKPYKRASRDFPPEDSVVDVGRGVRVGGGSFGGGCRSLRNRKPRGVDGDRRVGPPGRSNILRGGAFKPRTSPYSFQGMGEEGLKILQELGRVGNAGGHRGDGSPAGGIGRPLRRRVSDRRTKHANFNLLRRWADHAPVMLKRGMRPPLVIC
ncbi:MAG: hypothetical protein CM1200mP2_38760 [Planctomycetaceae bacterium]|nr:MAG: hypothetical protein CM1200mP2_38760 [Planctomycetaceae bacterium]